ncbi:hypothetical protein [Spirosoma pomorum]
MIDQKSAVQLLSYQLNYAMGHYNPADTSAQASSAMDHVVRQVPLDVELLQANAYDYGFLLSMYLQAGLYAPLTRNKSQAEVASLLPQLPLLADRIGRSIRPSFPGYSPVSARQKSIRITASGDHSRHGFATSLPQEGRRLCTLRTDDQSAICQMASSAARPGRT